MTAMRDDGIETGGLRERKRRETLQRISDAAVRLFIERGYDATTLDAIAAEAGISRRSFFSYFKSKDDILLSLQASLGDEVAAEVRTAPADKSPLRAVRGALIRLCAPYPAEEMLVIDRLMRSSEAVQARKQASYVQQEKTLFAALRERWPEPERETSLRLIAMMSIGAIRLSLDTMSREGGRRSLVDLLAEAFDALENRA